MRDAVVSIVILKAQAQISTVRIAIMPNIPRIWVHELAREQLDDAREARKGDDAQKLRAVTSRRGGWPR